MPGSIDMRLKFGTFFSDFPDVTQGENLKPAAIG
jgi:hypothetical protein